MAVSARVLSLGLFLAGAGLADRSHLGMGTYAVAGACHASDSLSSNLLAYVRSVATGADTASANTRAAWGIPLLAANKVKPVSRFQQCSQLAAAYDVAVATPGNPNRFIDAVTIDRGFVVVDRLNRSGEWIVAVVFDKNLVVKEKFAF